MKKIILAGLLIVMAATSSFGAASQAVLFVATAGGGGMGMNVAAETSNAVIGRLSTNDALGFKVTTAGYALITQHIQGTRSYASASDATAIFWAPETKATGHAEPSAANATAFATGWTVM